MTTRARTRVLGTGLVLLAVLAFSINLRIGIVSLAPVLEEIRDALGVSTSAAGVFTALPGFAFAVMGWTAVPLARKFGLSPALLFGGVLLLAGIGLRSLSSSYWPFLICTALVVCGIALGNVLLPAWIRAHGQLKNTLMLMTVFTTALGASAMIGPLSAKWFQGEGAWRQVLGIWAIPAAILVIVWAVVALRAGRDVPSTQAVEERHDKAPAATVSLRRSGTAVAMLVFFSMQSSAFYTQVGWLPQLMRDRGVSADTASTALIVLGGLGVIGGFVMPFLIARLPHVTPLAIAVTLFTLSGWIGLLWNTSAAPVLWATLLGIGSTAFPLAISLIASRTRAPLVTARLSGFVQPNGYLIAGAVPLLIGVLSSTLHGWTVPILLMIGVCILQMLAATKAGRNVFIDDELNAATR